MLNETRRQLADVHLSKLSEKYGIKLKRTRAHWHEGEADSVTRTVWVARTIRYGIDYLAALHELGHLVHPAAGGQYASSEGPYENDNSRRLQMEAAAWAWATKNALPEIAAGFTKKDRQLMGLGWASHYGPAL